MKTDLNKSYMKSKVLIAVFILMSVMSCKSRFTSTSDATGPRRHDHADVEPVKPQQNVQPADTGRGGAPVVMPGVKDTAAAVH